jgi:hypothetical protein
MGSRIYFYGKRGGKNCKIEGLRLTFDIFQQESNVDLTPNS